MDSNHDVQRHPETIKIIKSLCGFPKGGFFRKSPLAAGGVLSFIILRKAFVYEVGGVLALQEFLVGHYFFVKGDGGFDSFDLEFV